MGELEQQIAAWVDAETEGVDPVAADEAIGLAHHHALAPPTAGRTRRLAPIGLVAAAIVLIGALVVAARSEERVDDLRTGTTTSSPAPTETWEQLAVPELGWRLDRPVRAGVQSWTDRCSTIEAGDGSVRSVEDTGTLVTLGVKGPLRFDGSVRCSAEWAPEDLAQRELVALSVSRYEGGPWSPAELPDTQAPLALDDLTVVSSDTTETERRSRQVVIGGDHRYSVRTWVGPDADPADVTALERMIGSIRWDEHQDPTADEHPPTTRGGEVAPATGSSRMTTFISCMSDVGYHPYLADPPQGTVDGEVAAVLTWPAGEQDRDAYAADHARCNEMASESQRRRSNEATVWPLRAGPSQTPGDAERDGVVAELAEIPLQDRAVPTKWFDTPEGTWAITTMPARPDGTDCTVGDTDGAYGTERICTHEYGEVVLVDATGRLIRAYPMPGEVPTWIYPTRDAIYAGRVGDGALPESTIARIDRRSLDAEVLVFPADDGMLGVELDGWSVAPDAADISQLVVVGDDPAGPLVNSTIGITSVDLAAIEELFA